MAHPGMASVILARVHVGTGEKENSRSSSEVGIRSLRALHAKLRVLNFTSRVVLGVLLKGLMAKKR